MGDMQAQRFDHRRTLREHLDRSFINIVCEEHFRFLQLLTFLRSIMDLLRRIPVFERFLDLFLLFSLIQQGKHVIGNIVDHMYGAAVHIQHHVVAIVFILMDHSSCSFLYVMVFLL